MTEVEATRKVGPQYLMPVGDLHPQHLFINRNVRMIHPAVDTLKTRDESPNHSTWKSETVVCFGTDVLTYRSVGRTGRGVYPDDSLQFRLAIGILLRCIKRRRAQSVIPGPVHGTERGSIRQRYSR